MTKNEWLLQLRRCQKMETLEKIIEKKGHELCKEDLEAFNSAADHRLAEITMNRLYDKIPPSVWSFVK